MEAIRSRETLTPRDIGVFMEIQRLKIDFDALALKMMLEELEA